MTKLLIADPTQLRALARVSMRDYPGGRGETVPVWIAELAMLPVDNFHAMDSLMRAGLIICSDGWRLTEIGWRALEASKPKAHP